MGLNKVTVSSGLDKRGYNAVPHRVHDGYNAVPHQVPAQPAPATTGQQSNGGSAPAPTPTNQNSNQK
jgi:hypothetical protein